jgi:hypothetical protein
MLKERIELLPDIRLIKTVPEFSLLAGKFATGGVNL